VAAAAVLDFAKNNVFVYLGTLGIAIVICLQNFDLVSLIVSEM